MKIIDIIYSKGKTGFFFDDQKAIKENAEHDGNFYIGEPKTEGFNSIRQAGESISIIFILEDGQIAYGDCAAVQYSGAAGRDPLFLADNFIDTINEEIIPLFKGSEITSFREMSNKIDSKKLHTALRYGVTQAILDTVAKSQKKLMCKIIEDEYNVKISNKLIPIFSQSGDERYSNVDKMILKGSNVLPHALINTIGKLGENGEKLMDYVKWLKNRVEKFRVNSDYDPEFHIDVYGTFGIIFNNDLEKIADYMIKLGEAAKPFKLRIEGPVDMGNREKQMEALRDLTLILKNKKSDVGVVADEWCNTFEDIKYFSDNAAGTMVQIKTPDLGGINNCIEAVLYCKEKNIGAYLGGTCNETERSAQICAHIAIATNADQILAKPGMGVDEGFMIVHNEMQRILAITNR